MSGTALFLGLAVSSTISHPMTNRQWVTLLWFLGSLINHASSHDQQGVSDTGLFLCQSVMSYSMTNRMWVTLLYFFARQSHQSCHTMTIRQWVTLLFLPTTTPSHHQQVVSIMKFSNEPLIQLPIVSEWHAIFASRLSSDDTQLVSENALFFIRQFHFTYIIPWWPTGSVWYTI